MDSDRKTAIAVGALFIIADMARLQICPWVEKAKAIKAHELRPGRQARHAAKLWRCA